MMNDAFHRERYLLIVRKNTATLNNLAAALTLEEARKWRDGGDGWTVLEVLCHLADFDEIFYQRVQAMLQEDNPSFVLKDHERMVIDNRCNEQQLSDVMARLNHSRQRFLAAFDALSEEQWARRGTHPEQGDWNVMRSLIQLATHDTTHIEQITRILLEKKASSPASR
jgi:uncharacterized damage-inducible protein DinB